MKLGGRLLSVVVAYLLAVTIAAVFVPDSVPAWVVAVIAVCGAAVVMTYLATLGQNYRTLLEQTAQRRRADASTIWASPPEEAPTPGGAGGAGMVKVARGAMMPTRPSPANFDPAAHMAGHSPALIPADEWQGVPVLPEDVAAGGTTEQIRDRARARLANE